MVACIVGTTSYLEVNGPSTASYFPDQATVWYNLSLDQILLLRFLSQIDGWCIGRHAELYCKMSWKALNRKMRRNNLMRQLQSSVVQEQQLGGFIS